MYCVKEDGLHLSGQDCRPSIWHLETYSLDEWMMDLIRSAATARLSNSLVSYEAGARRDTNYLQLMALPPKSSRDPRDILDTPCLIKHLAPEMRCP
jgi:hypothetical protein